MFLDFCINEFCGIYKWNKSLCHNLKMSKTSMAWICLKHWKLLTVYQEEQLELLGQKERSSYFEILLVASVVLPGSGTELNQDQEHLWVLLPLSVSLFLCDLVVSLVISVAAVYAPARCCYSTYFFFFVIFIYLLFWRCFSPVWRQFETPLFIFDMQGGKSTWSSSAVVCSSFRENVQEKEKVKKMFVKFV